MYGWTLSQKLSLRGFKWVEETSQFIEDFIKSYNDDSDNGYFLEVNVQYTKNLHNHHNDLPFFPERIKMEKVKKTEADFHDKEEYVIHIKSLKQALNHGLALKKVHRIIKFNQKAWLKPHIAMNTELR